ncbi:MAG: iron uptake transporter deferrochelatase/peroxidase subunit [Cardiobacteriaceae bacterium]|nr:iron uptake transporter deferrochelatase/peroxidase subunit [Cardiobacteriaceae bacterium]
MKSAAPGRRDFLKQLGFASAGLVAGTAAYAQAAPTPSTDAGSAANTVPFFGAHQAGITTPAQKHIYFLVADLHSTDIAAIREVFQLWTAYAANLTRGEHVKPYGSNVWLPPTDTGEADSLNPHNLTLTFGVSPSFFDKLGIAHLRPAALRDLPHFPRDQLKAHYSGGDLCIQACADDPQVAFHAVRNLVRAARLHITMRWSQSGFNSFDHRADTPRNLFAFKDGTANLSGDALDEVVWSNGDDWLKGGTYLIARRIQMFLETWDRTSLAEQHNTFGRLRDSGAPMGQEKEFDTIDLSLKDEKGEPAMPEDSHVHLAHKTGRNILRRSFSYASGIDDKGQFDAGLLFISFQKDPASFIEIQNAFGNIDKMNEYITHIGSGLFACFPGVRDESDYLGKALFEQIKS